MRREVEDLRVKPVEELKKLLVELKGELMRLRFKNAYGQLEDTSSIRKTKRKIARILTILNEKSAS